ncbi:MAG: transporter substrate-binding domain-containing protein [Candidatus Spyradocola sp.]|jgi:ABC-type amino acid transport substrate-binding protein
MKKTAKFLALLCAVLMLVAAVTGCSSAPAEESAESPAPSESPAAEETAAPSASAEATEAPTESAEPATETPTLDAIRERGTLILGTESTYPPFEFIVMENGTSVTVGFDVSLAQAIADKLGVELVTSEMAFDSLIPAVQAGNVDIAASITPTDERKEAVDFSDNYYDTTNVFVVRKGEEGNFTSKESFTDKTIGAQMGTAQNTLVVEDMTNAKSLLLPKTTTLIQELNTGNIDAICLEKPVADIYVAAYPDDLALCSYEVPVEGGGVAIPVAKGNDDLLAFINEVIAEMKANGEMDRIYQEACTLAIDQLGDE